MEEEYASNSHKSKEKMANEANKKKEKVATGEIKEKTGFQKFLDNFISQDMGSVGDYILESIIIPQIKELISKIASQGVNWILYGDSRPRNSSNKSRISYNRLYDDDYDVSNYDQRTVKKAYDTGDVLFRDKGEADLLLDTMRDDLEEYGIVTVADFYDLAGIDTNDNYQNNKYGWYDLTGASVRPTRGGFMINLPRPRVVNN